jgi:hypothetical protein
MIGYYCEAVRDLKDNSRIIEAGAGEVLERLNSVGALVAFDKEQALGIVDESKNLLATVTAYVSKGVVSAVTVDSLVNGNLSKTQGPNSKLRVVSLGLAATDVPQLKDVADLSLSSSHAVLESLKTQASLAKDKSDFIISAIAGSPSLVGWKSVNGTLVVEDPTDLSALLTKDDAGRVIFRSRGFADNPLRGVFANQQVLTK